MLPATHNIKVPRGGTFQHDIRIKDNLGSYIDFQAAYLDTPGAGLGEIRMYVRKPWKLDPQRQTKATPLLKLSTATGEITIVNNTTLRITLTAAETAALPFSEGQYDIELCTGDDPEWVDKPLKGQFTVDDEVTN